MTIASILKGYFFIIISLASIVGSAIAAPYISNFAGVASPDPTPLIPSASAVSLPFPVDHHIKIKEKVGDPVRIEEWVNDADRNCEMSCTYVEYRPGSQGRAGLAFVADSPVDLSGAKRVHFFLMGDKGGEMVKVKVAGKNPMSAQNMSAQQADSLFKEKFAKSSNVVTLTNDWKRYEISLDGVDLKGITAPFGIELLKGNNTSAKQAVYFKFIVYERELIDQRFALAANSTDNATALTADNATTTPDNNAVQGNNNTRGQTNENTRGNSGNTTTAVDTGRIDNDDNNSNNNATSSAPVNNATAGTSGEQINNNGRAAVEPADNENSPPTAIAAVDNLVAHPNDNVILDGSLSNDPDGDKVAYHWSQSDGPSVDIIDADTATPTITIPNLDEDDKVTIDLVVGDGQSESNKASVVINIQYVEEIEGSNKQNLGPDDVLDATGWSDAECGSNSGTARNDGASVIINCLTDNSDSTFISSEAPGKSDLLLSLQDYADADTIDTNTSNSIAYVTAQVTAKKTANSSFISFLLDNPNEQEHYVTPSLSILSDSFEDYSFSWKYDPVTGGPWSVDSLNSLVAGYRYLAGQGSLEISEFRLIVTTIIGQEEQQEEEPDGSSTVDEEERSTTVEEPATNDEDSAIDEEAPAEDNVSDASAVESDGSQRGDESEQDDSPNGI